MAAASDKSEWFAVRCVFLSFADTETEEKVYEERVTLWHADSDEQAIARAEEDALSYVADLGKPPTSYLGLAQSYRLADEPGDGAEVFSLMRTSALPPDGYLDAFFDTGTEHQQHM